MPTHAQTLTYILYMCSRRLIHPHVHVHWRKIGCALFQSQSTFIRAVSVNWRAVLGKQKTNFLKLTRFHHFGRFPLSPVFSGSFLLFDKRWAFPSFSLPGPWWEKYVPGIVYSWVKENMCSYVQFRSVLAVTKEHRGGKRLTDRNGIMIF